MRVEADNNLVFDENDSRCIKEVLQLSGDKIDYDDNQNMLVTYGEYLAFIQCFDKTSGMVKRYCGLYDPQYVESSINNIMMTGSKFESVLNRFYSSI